MCVRNLMPNGTLWIKITSSFSEWQILQEIVCLFAAVQFYRFTETASSTELWLGCFNFLEVQGVTVDIKYQYYGTLVTLTKGYSLRYFQQRFPKLLPTKKRVCTSTPTRPYESWLQTTLPLQEYRKALFQDIEATPSLLKILDLEL